MWLVEYSAEAEHYAEVNLPYVTNVIRAVIRLMLTSDGQTTAGTVELWDDDVYLWTMGEYELFIRQEEERTVTETIGH